MITGCRGTCHASLNIHVDKISEFLIYGKTAIFLKLTKLGIKDGKRWV
jgi:hypothetical protein